MKKIYLAVIFFLPVILFNNCEQPVGEEEFPYELKLVIRSIIEPDQLINNIYIGRTLPVAVPYDESFANLTDAVGAVVSDGIFYPLRHIASGIYTTDSLVAKLGSTYSLVVQWQNKSVSAETKIPLPGTVLSYGINSFYSDGKQVSAMEVAINPLGNESYTVTWLFFNFNGILIREADSFEQVVRSGFNQHIKVRSAIVPPAFLNNDIGYLGIRLFIYDSSFFDYYFSQGAGQTPDAIFGQTGTNVKWNVKGDGIGMFIGRSNIVRSP